MSDVIDHAAGLTKIAIDWRRRCEAAERQRDQLFNRLLDFASAVHDAATREPGNWQGQLRPLKREAVQIIDELAERRT